MQTYMGRESKKGKKKKPGESYSLPYRIYLTLSLVREWELGLPHARKSNALLLRICSGTGVSRIIRAQSTTLGGSCA